MGIIRVIRSIRVISVSPVSLRLVLILVEHAEQAHFAGLNQKIFADQDSNYPEEFLDADIPVAGLGQRGSKSVNA